MFENNKYTKWYYSIIENAKKRLLETSYKPETHHIIPKSMNGSNDLSNLVKLTLREHFLCHWLLTKMTKGQSHYLMCYALRMMMNYSNTKGSQRFLSSWQYERARKALKGVKHGKAFCEKQKQNNIGNKNPMFGKKHKKESKLKTSLSLKKYWALKNQNKSILEK